MSMGVMVGIEVYAADEEKARAACQAAFKRIDLVDYCASDYRIDSELNRLCARAGGEPVVVSDDLFLLLQKGQEMARLSDGRFDITVGPLVGLWRESRRTKRLPDRDRLDEARALVGHEKLVLDPKKKTAQLKLKGMRLDLGGVAKGFAGDVALAELRQHGIRIAAIELGGDIVLGDAPPGRPGWMIDVVNEQRGRPSQKMMLKNCAISTSGASVQYVTIDRRTYSHVIDPRTGLGFTEQYLTTVIAPRGLDSDPLSKVASFMGPTSRDLFLKQYPGVKVRFGYEGE